MKHMAKKELGLYKMEVLMQHFMAQIQRDNLILKVFFFLWDIGLNEEIQSYLNVNIRPENG